MKAIQQLITTPDSLLFRLLQHLQQIEEMQKTLDTLLPAPLNQHCYVANFNEDKVIIYADSALWATQFRMNFSKLQLMGRSIAKPRVRPRNQKITPTPPVSPLVVPDDQTIEQLCHQADHLSYLPLKVALLNLADHFIEQKARFVK